MNYRSELATAYKNYYSDRRKFEDSNSDPKDWELPLWEKWEKVFIDIYRKHHT